MIILDSNIVDFSYQCVYLQHDIFILSSPLIFPLLAVQPSQAGLYPYGPARQDMELIPGNNLYKHVLLDYPIPVGGPLYQDIYVGYDGQHREIIDLSNMTPVDE